MVIKKVTDKEFRKYGRIISEIDFSEIIAKMAETPCPEDGTVYEPSVEMLEALPIMDKLQNVVYGELPIQVGYCNGVNYMLNALEYHRASEVDIAAEDLIVLLGCQQDITDDFTYDTAKVEAFLVPKGTAVELYATTLHYAPCSSGEKGYRCVIVLPKGTNTELKEKHTSGYEDALLAANNKWLIAHAEGGQAEGSHIGLIGENLCVK